MGEMVTFPSNGTGGQGYLATPASGSGPGVVVIQEWWGLNDQIKGVCDRYASEGFVALAPDLYRGEVTSEPDEAGKLMMSLNIEQAAKDMVGAVHYLLSLDATTGDTVGATGYCMGGALVLRLGTMCPDKIGALAPYYGVVGWPQAPVDWSKCSAPIQGHYATDDDFASPEAVAAFADELRALGKQVEIFTYEDTQHAFTNEQRPEVHDAEATEQAFQRTFAFFRERLGA
ncbi:MAG TPA: dienelactone hydrolase family protein [Acidimicrobiia bacterium]|nr:dienelactone hydrolase family protein [Acidimicrobiia bacterium]